MPRAPALLLLAACSSFSGDPQEVDGGADASPTVTLLPTTQLATLAGFPVALAATSQSVAVFDQKTGRLFTDGTEVPAWYTTQDSSIQGPAFGSQGRIFFLTSRTARSCAVGGPCSASDDLGFPSAATLFAVATDGLAYGSKTSAGVCKAGGCSGGGGGKEFDFPLTGASALGLSTSLLFVGTAERIITLERKASPDPANLYDGEPIGPVAAMTVSSGQVVFSTANDLNACGVVRSGCKPTHIAKTKTTAREPVIRGQSVFWIEPDLATVFTCPLTGCAAPAPIAVVNDAQHVAVADRIYVATSNALWRTDPISSSP